jgi:hypothetical protein
MVTSSLSTAEEFGICDLADIPASDPVAVANTADPFDAPKKIIVGKVANRIDGISHPHIITNPIVEAALQRYSPAQEVCHIEVFQVQARVAAGCK